MMQSTFCSNCNQPLPAGAVFCGNCGAPQKPSGSQSPGSPTPSSAQGAETMRAAIPPSGAEYAPTQFVPPPAPEAPAQGSAAGHDIYALQYPSAPPAPPPAYPYQAGQAGPGAMYPPAGPQGQVMPPPPAYAPGPPPVVNPGGVAPWAQPPKKRSGMKVALGCLLVLVLVAAVVGGGGFLLVKALTSENGSASHQGNGSSGAGGTPGSGSTPGGTAAGTQTLNAINRQAIYAGAMVTIVSAKEAASLPEHQESDPATYALEVQAKVSNQTSQTIYPTVTALTPDGNTYEVANATPSSFDVAWSSNGVATGSWFFDVPSTSKIGDFQIQIGGAKDALVTVPLTGNYDPNQWQQVTHQINQAVTYDDGQIKGTVTQVIVGLWSSGYQAPKDMRFLLMYLHVTNNTALSINVGDGTPPQYLLVFPNGDRSQPTDLYGSLIDAVVGGGESKDVGYDTFLIPMAPAPYVLVFLNPNGSTAGQVNLGTL